MRLDVHRQVQPQQTNKQNTAYAIYNTTQHTTKFQQFIFSFNLYFVKVYRERESSYADNDKTRTLNYNEYDAMRTQFV